MDRDYYQILGVSEDASQEQIKAAYRRLAFQYHPDRNKEDTAAAEKMKEINEAYAILSNQAKRKEYDLKIVMDLLPRRDTGRDIQKKIFLGIRI